MTHCIGTCSLCGGRVTMPNAWYSVRPPVPTCESCGATAAAHGPVVQMVPKRAYGFPTSIIVARNGPERPLGASTLSPYTVDSTAGHQ